MNQRLTTGKLMRRILAFAKPFRKTLAIITVCVFLEHATTAINNIFLGRIFDLVPNHASTGFFEKACMYVWMAAAVVAVRIVISAIRFRTSAGKFDIQVSNYLNHQSIATFFTFSAGQHINEHSGVKQGVVNSGIQSIQNQINVMTYQFVPWMAQLVMSVCVIAYASWTIGFAFIGIAAVFAGLMYWHNKKVVPGIREIRDQKVSNSRLISEMYRLVGLVKIEAQEERSLHELDTAQDTLRATHVKTWLPAGDRFSVIRLTSNVLRYATMFLVVFLLSKGTIGPGSLYLIFSYSGFFIEALWQLMDVQKQMLTDRANIEKYLDLLDVKSDIVHAENPIRPKAFFGKIEFRNVSFWYAKRTDSYDTCVSGGEQEDPVLKSVSFTINQGEQIGIVGESGSGKSTLANLLRRGFDPQEGQILIDDNDLRLLDLKHYLMHVGSVEQEVALFDRSIRDNILFGLNGTAKMITDERLHELAKLARIDGFFPRLEHGFDTMVGEKGVKLSGGERQRVGIARALAKNPSLLIFDEATSALDAVSEKIVQQSIEDACKGKTAIIIAHRLSTVKNCDKILVFRHGILVGEGTHEYLLNSCEYYAELVSHQMVAA